MQPKGVVTTGKQYRYNPSWAQAPDQITSNLSKSRHIVTPGAMINGNHKDPYDWQYSVEDKRYYHGEFKEDVLTGTYAGSSVRWVGETGNGTGPSAPAWDRTLVYNMALSKLNSKVRGDLDLGLALAEAGSTVRMVKSIKKVIDFSRIHRLGSTRDLANGWLQWKYGWSPLVGDVFKAADESIRIILNELQHIKVRVTLPLAVNRRYTNSSNGWWSAPGLYWAATGHGKQSCTIGIRLAIPSFDLSRWTSLNPVSLGWERIPYSFVVDWFLDISSYLRNLESGLLYQGAFQKGYVSELYYVEQKDTAILPQSRDVSTVPLIRDTLIRSVGEIRKIDFFRNRLLSYPLPRKPTFKVDLSSQRLLSAAALLRQILSK